MEHIIKRCKHCGKEYTYCTYGNGAPWGTNEHCTETYCGTCGLVIKEALKRIPKKYESQYNDFIPDEKLLKEFERLREANKKRYESTSHIMLLMMQFQNMERFVIGCVEYVRVWNDDEPDGGLYRRLEEYDIDEKKFTGNVWYTTLKCPYEYSRGTGIDAKQVNEMHLQEPISLIPYWDFPQIKKIIEE